MADEPNDSPGQPKHSDTPQDERHPPRSVAPDAPRRPVDLMRSPAIGLATAGIELGLTLVLLVLLGRWLDAKLGSAPWLMLAGAAIGIVGGLYRLWLNSRRFIKTKPRN